MISGRVMVRLMAALSLSTIGFGVPAGAIRPSQMVASNPGTPASAMVGTSGSTLDRVVAVVPSGAHLAGLNVRGHGGDGVEHHLDMAADDGIAAVACGLVRHMDDVGAGHFLEQFGGHVIGRAGAGRGIVESAGLALASAIRSVRFFAGTEGWTTSTSSE